LGGVIEDVFDLLKRLLRGFWEEEEHMDEHGYTEDTEDDVNLPADIRESRGHEISQSKVECPVCRSRKSHSLSTDTEGVQFWRVDPGYWSPSRSE
jgi:hypothetical protein